MSYTIERAALVARQLQRIATYNAHELVGQLANLEFWLGEAAQSLAVIDDYPRRFARLHAGQTEWVEAHQIRITPQCAHCGGPCEYSGAQVPAAPKRIGSQQLDDARRAVRDASYQLLRRLYRNGWIDEERFRASCARLGTSVDLDDLEDVFAGAADSDSDAADARSAVSDATSLVPLAELSSAELEALAQLTLPAAQGHVADWLANIEAARAEIADAIGDDKIALVLRDGDRPVAWIAAGHDWGAIWEIHPVIVAVDAQGRGHGQRLVREVERLAADAGARTMALSTSDTVGATSLAGADLYADVAGHLARFTVHRPHAAAFWLRMGYTLVGVTPDAEGPGQPSLSFACRLPAGGAGG